MKWRDLSEQVAGLTLKSLDKKSKYFLPPDAVNPNTLCEPYNAVVPMVREGKDIAFISVEVGVEAINAALNAADSINQEIPAIQWLKALEKVAAKATAAYKLKPYLKQLEEGDEIGDFATILKIFNDLDMGFQELVPMSKVDGTAPVWVKTGFAPWDDNFYGLPEASLTIIGASPGVGKTSLMLEVVKRMILLKENKKKQAAIFTLEMTMSQLTHRMLDIADLKEADKERILLGDGSYNIHEIYAAASRACAQHNLCVIAIDFADQIVEGEQTEATMGIIYRTLAMLAKKTGVPVVLLSQLNREAYLNGGIPRVHHLRYSGLAEAMAGLIILLYNPKNISMSVSKDNPLPATSGKGYLIVGKSRYGYVHGEPGAVMVDWNGEEGWGDTTLGFFSV